MQFISLCPRLGRRGQRLLLLLLLLLVQVLRVCDATNPLLPHPKTKGTGSKNGGHLRKGLKAQPEHSGQPSATEVPQAKPLYIRDKLVVGISHTTALASAASSHATAPPSSGLLPF